MVPSLLNLKFVGSPEKGELRAKGVESHVAAETVVKVAPSVTVNVASSLTVPVSSCAVGALFVELTVRVITAVSVAPNSSVTV